MGTEQQPDGPRNPWTFPEPRFVGSRRPEGTVVWLGDEVLPLRLDVANHSPDGFEWGYGGSGPAQLALAMLCAVTQEAEASREYEDFKRDCVAQIACSDWSLPTSLVEKWLRDRRHDHNTARRPDFRSLDPWNVMRRNRSEPAERILHVQRLVRTNGDQDA